MSGMPHEFEQAQRRYDELTNLLRQGMISPEQFAAELGALQVIDQRGVTWQPNPAASGWLYWNGAQWCPASLQPVEPRRPPGGNEPPGKRQRAKGMLSMAGLGGKTARVPMKQRPRFWWDALSVWAGIVVGLIWLAYSAVRGLPHLVSMDLSKESSYDFIPAVTILAVPLILFILRRTILARLNVFLLRCNSISAKTKLAVLVGILAGGWILGKLMVFLFKTSGFFEMREGLDLATPAAMIVIPMLLVFFRRETDEFLRPMHGVLKHIPKILLTLVALAIPFVLGFLLSMVFGLEEYNLLKWNVILGVLISYALLRTPQATSKPTAPSLSAAAMFWISTVGLLLADLLFNIQTSWADDFKDDPFNLNDGLRTAGVAPALSGTASGLSVVGVNGVEILRNLTGASEGGRGTAPPRDRTQLLSGNRAQDWLRDNGFIDGNSRFTPAFTEWYDRLPSDDRPTDLQGIAGEFDPNGSSPDDIAIVVTDHSKPPEPVIDDSGQAGSDSDQSRPDEKPDATPGPGTDDSTKPPEKTKPPVPPTVPPVPPDPPETGEKTPPESTPPEPPPPSKPTDATTPDQGDKVPGLDDKKYLEALAQLATIDSAQGNIIRCAGIGGSVSLSDIVKWLHKQGDRIRAPFEDFYNWYTKKWLKTCESTRITDKHRLPDRIIKHGLFDTSRGSPLSQGVRQSMINAGVDPKVADAVIKRIESQGAEDAQIARLANKLLRTTRALTLGGEASITGGTSAGGAAAGHDVITPDITSIVERMALTQQSNYQSAVDRWRDTQSTGRWARTGASISSPQSQQEVDKLLQDLQGDQRQLKKQLGFDMDRMRKSEDMRQLWKEEQALKDLRKEVADMNLLKRLGRK